MITRIVGFVLCCVVALSMAGLSHAQPRIQPPGGGGGAPQPSEGAGVLTRVKPEMTVQLLKQAGYKDVQLGKGNENVQPVLAKIGEVPMQANHFDCNADGCRIVTFVVFFGPQPTLDLAYMNEWHKAWRFVKIYRFNDENVNFMWDLPVLSGVTPAYLVEAARLYATMLGKVMEFKPAGN